MSNLEATVRKVVDSFVNQSNLFTALDVSNEVKKTNPLARHKEVRDIVRAIYSDMQVSGYGRTPIQVTLADGSQVDALLYHSLADSWDLDVKYDNQKRAASLPAPAPMVVAPTMTINIPSNPSVPAPVVVTPVAPPVVTNPKQLWTNLFGGVKLFPRQ